MVAGPVEATAIGNVLIQARAHGLLRGDLDDLRGTMATTLPTDAFRATTGSGRKGLTIMSEKMKRRLPSRHDLAPLMQFKKPEFDATKRRLDKALTIEDLRRIAKRRTPRAAFDYTDGSAEAELSIARARQAFSDIEFHPAILRDVSKVEHRLGRPRRAGGACRSASRRPGSPG